MKAAVELDRRRVSLLALVAAILPGAALARVANAPDDGFAALSPLADLYGATVPQTWPGEAAARLDPTMDALFFAGLAYQGRQTRHFAIRGRPPGQGPHPAIVLVHGGGGTAYAEWVRRWVAAGFVAISIALEGQTDTPARVGGARWSGHDFSGPARRGIYGDFEQPIAEQWMYHAVGAAILAANLLRADPLVDPARVGLCGISWGGVIAATTIGLAPDFAFAVPIYGGGFLDRQDNQYSVLRQRPLYSTLWEPGLRLARYRNPSLWISWPGDQHFSLDSQARSYAAVSGAHAVSLRPGMTHNHPAGWSAPEAYAFARSVVDRGGPWAVMTDAVVRNGRAEASFFSAQPPSAGELLWTPERGHTGTRNWTPVAAQVTLEREGHYRLAARLPDEAQGWFINARAGDLIASSDYQFSSSE